MDRKTLTQGVKELTVATALIIAYFYFNWHREIPTVLAYILLGSGISKIYKSKHSKC